VPGKIDNGTLQASDGTLSPKLVENYNYQVVPIPTWTLLVGWYGLKGPSHAFKREVVRDGA
jgi:hypothetical protein